MAASIYAVPVDKLEGLLECSICKRMVKDPRTLPCFHSYCKDCLDKYVKHHRKNRPRVKVLNCPVCRTKFTLDPEGVQGMPRNHFICNMLDAMTVQNRVKGVPCSNHCEEPSAGRCITCEMFMCNKCLQAHKNWPPFRDHSVLSMEELSKPENKAKIKGRSYCKKHPKKELKFYCETCNELICRRCMDFDHSKPDHMCSSLETVAEEKLEALKINCLTFESKLSEGNEALPELTNYAQLLEDNMEKARRKINERLDVHSHLRQVAAGRSTRQQKLTFDRSTGKLRVTDQGDLDNVLCTDMAADGFFTNFLALNLNLLF